MPLLKPIKSVFRTSCTLIALISITACASTNSAVTTKFYTVSGQTGAQIDKELQLKGPLSGHALASAAISFEPVSVLQEKSDKGCRFKTAKFRVKADITLPQWTGRSSTKDQNLRRAWDGLSKYAKLHEEAHVKIAEEFATEIGRQIKALDAQETCERLDKTAEKRFKKLLRLHDRAQRRFDAIEQKRLATIFAKA